MTLNRVIIEDSTGSLKGTRMKRNDATAQRHPYIEHRSDIANGKAVVTGTRIKVSQIALEYERLGWTPDQIIDAHPHLSLAQVHDALSYYYENQAELDAERKGVVALRSHYPSN
jgi:uncharacterized protein (DUF433 family)